MRKKVNRIGLAIVLLVGADALYSLIQPQISAYGKELRTYLFIFCLLLYLSMLLIGRFMIFRETRRSKKEAPFGTMDITQLINCVPVGICMTENNATAHILSANDFFYELFGYTPDQARETGIASIYDFLSAENKQRLVCVLENANRESLQKWEFESSAECRNGENIDILVRCRFNGADRSYIISSVIDVTEHYRIRNELQLSEKSYRAAVGLTNRMITRFDPRTSVSVHLFDSMTQLGLPQITENTPEAQIAAGLICPGSEDKLRVLIDHIRRGIPVQNLTIEMNNRAMGEKRWYEFRYECIQDSAGQAIQAIIVFEDVTEAREKEIAYNMHRQTIEAMPKDQTIYYEYNLTRDFREYRMDEITGIALDENLQWDQLICVLRDRLICDENSVAIMRTLARAHLLEQFGKGNTDISQDFSAKDLRSGHNRWMRLTANMTADRYIGDVKLYCLIQDIDREKSAELEQQRDHEQIRNYKMAYDRLSNAILYGIATCKNDANMSILFGNPAFYQLHGYASEAAAIQDGFTSGAAKLYPTLFARIKQGCEPLIRGEKKRYVLEYPLPEKNIWMLCSIAYQREQNAFNVTLMDITDRKNAERTLAVRENDYRIAVQMSKRQVFIYDISSGDACCSIGGMILLHGPETIHGLPESALAHDLIAPESEEEFRSFFAAMRSGAANGHGFARIREHASDDYRWFAGEFRMVYDNSNNPVHAIVAFADVTEQHEMEIAYHHLRQSFYSAAGRKTSLYECNLTRNKLESEMGQALPPVPEEYRADLQRFVQYNAEHYFLREDRLAFENFASVDRILKNYRTGTDTESIVLRVQLPDKHLMWMEISVQLMTDPETDEIKALCSIHDVDETKTRELQLQHDIAELQKELENSRIRIMMNQMQPHFLYNSLSAIRAITKTDPDYAYDLLYDFSMHLRSSIKALSSDAPIPFCEEMENIQAYLNIEKMRLGSRLNIVFDIQTTDFTVIPLSIQPIVENAVRHGVFKRGAQGGTVRLIARSVAGGHEVQVIDDGVGFDKDAVLTSNRDSVGLKSLIFRLGSLMNAQVDIQSRISVGTTITVYIPIPPESKSMAD